MRIFRVKQIFYSFLAATFLTAMLHSIHTNGLQEIQKKQTLELSQQIITQIESLIFYAQDHGIVQPIPWAIQFFSTGLENKPIHVKLIKDAPIKNTSNRHWVDFELSSSHYQKILNQESGIGAEITIRLPLQGSLVFLRSGKTTSASGIFFILFYLFFIFVFRSGLKPSKPHYFEKLPQILPLVELWIQEHHLSLLDFGQKTKQLAQSAKKLLSSRSSETSAENLSIPQQEFQNFITELLQSLMRQAKDLNQLKISLKDVVARLRD